MEDPEVYDLLILMDATLSMGSYLGALSSALPKIIAISTLTDCFSRIGIVAYRDYCDKELIEWSGWLDRTNPREGITQAQLVEMVSNLKPKGGGDFPEATKTGLAKMYEVMRKEARTVVLFYTDAPPQTPVFAERHRGSNFLREKKALSSKGSYGGTGEKFADWVSAAAFLHSGEKRAQIFSILRPRMDKYYSGHYIYLSTMTRGSAFYLKDDSPETIAQVTVDLLLSWMGAEKAGVDQTTKLPAKMSRYKSIDKIQSLRDEVDHASAPFFISDSRNQEEEVQNNVVEADVTPELLKQHLSKKKTPVQDFAKRYAHDKAFKSVVVEQLTHIIETDVSSISLNPVFGTLWRAVCNDRENPSRESIISSFGRQIERIPNPKEKQRMKAWLEESYDFSTVVLEAIDLVPEAMRFPCVVLDPTLAFTDKSNAVDEEGQDNRPITKFTRDELLDIGRGCDHRILRRLGKVLTQLTYVNSAEELPAHLAVADEKEVPRMPLALADKQHGQKFWKMLLHLVVPGTMLAARPAALLAALAIRMGVQPLYPAADQELIGWRDKWNDLTIPETWNTNCLSLLLDADESYRNRVKKKQANGDDANTPENLIIQKDRQLFELLVSYKLAEVNLHTTLTAQVGWTPEKTVLPIGPLAICRTCKYPRSVTIMAAHGVCGLCVADDYKSKEDKDESLAKRVSTDDTDATPASWVECNVATCRAQYVVYCLENLNVRPKCHYCRVAPTLPAKKRAECVAPWVECLKCLNRMIWPKEYRTNSSEPFICIACSNGKRTIIEVETSAQDLSMQNGNEWLLRNDSQKIKEPFNNRSLFHTISTAGADDFCGKVELFPSVPSASNLTIKGKLIRNMPELKSQLQSWIDRRAAETVPCSLCFSNFRKVSLRPACGRSGCIQRICADCLSSWYGLNGPGRIINTAALSCPFCRRAPSAKTLATYGMGIHAVADLKLAVEEQGQWIYAWCLDCGRARRHMERVCAAGAPQAVHNFACELCNDTALARARRAAEAAQEALAVATAADLEEAERLARDTAARLRFLEESEAAKPCPGCGTMTQKSSGCDHLTCMVPGCGTHWCWFCGDAFDEDVIYEHMEEDHGGFFAGGYGSEDDGEYEVHYG